LLLAALSVFAPGIAHADDPVTLRFGFPAPPSSYLYTWGAAPWAEGVNKAANGQAEVKLFVGSSVATFANVYDRIQNGVIELGFGTVQADFPRTNVSQMPYEGRNSHEGALALWRLYTKGLLADDWERVKVLALFTFSGSGIHTNKPIKSLTDMDGMKLASQNRVSARAASLLGAAPVTLTPSDTYQSLSRGLAQGIHSSWAAVEVFKLEEVTHYHLEVAWGLAPGYIAMNKDSYAKLPDAVRRAVDLASYEKFSVTLGDSMDAQNNDVRKRVAAIPGHTVYQLDAAETAVWKTKLAPIIEDWVKETPNGAAILAAFREELTKIRAGM